MRSHAATATVRMSATAHYLLALVAMASVRGKISNDTAHPVVDVVCADGGPRDPTDERHVAAVLIASLGMMVTRSSAVEEAALEIVRAGLVEVRMPSEEIVVVRVPRIPKSAADEWRAARDALKFSPV